jgi:hypothetical protein
MEKKVRGGESGKDIFYIKMGKLGNKAVVEVYMAMGVRTLTVQYVAIYLLPFKGSLTT